MNWTRHGEMGMICPPYYVAKMKRHDNTFEYVVRFEYEVIGRFDDFESCQMRAEAHKAEASK